MKEEYKEVRATLISWTQKQQLNLERQWRIMSTWYPGQSVEELPRMLAWHESNSPVILIEEEPTPAKPRRSAKRGRNFGLIFKE